MMKELYVISGVAGMTGSELAKILVAEGHRVIARQLSIRSIFTILIKHLEPM